VWIITGNRSAEFHGNILSLSENIAQSTKGGGATFFDSPCSRLLLYDFETVITIATASGSNLANL